MGRPVPRPAGADARGPRRTLAAHLRRAPRRGWIYLDRPAPFLTERLSDIAPAFGAIRTNPVTATYLRELADCIARYPATRTSVLPDNPFVYQVFDLTKSVPHRLDGTADHARPGAHAFSTWPGGSTPMVTTRCCSRPSMSSVWPRWGACPPHRLSPSRTRGPGWRAASSRSWSANARRAGACSSFIRRRVRDEARRRPAPSALSGQAASATMAPPQASS